MDPYSSPYIVPNKNPYNPFSHSPPKHLGDQAADAPEPNTVNQGDEWWEQVRDSISKGLGTGV